MKPAGCWTSTGPGPFSAAAATWPGRGNQVWTAPSSRSCASSVKLRINARRRFDGPSTSGRRAGGPTARSRRSRSVPRSPGRWSGVASCASRPTVPDTCRTGPGPPTGSGGFARRALRLLCGHAPGEGVTALEAPCRGRQHRLSGGRRWRRLDEGRRVTEAEGDPHGPLRVDRNSCQLTVFTRPRTVRVSTRNPDASMNAAQSSSSAPA